MAGMRMVVGLGNPGTEYVGTRHNTGFEVIDALAKKLQIELTSRKFAARVGSGEVADRKVMLLKPWQFMNRSGMAVTAAVGFYRIGIGDLIVVTDDMALEPGRIRIRAGGSAGGHNGLADIIEKLGTNEFARCRVGIGQSRDRWAVDYVLDKPTEAEKVLIGEAIARARDALLCWIEHGTEKAMNEFNKV
ncbi:MAG: aminoacyl-tRNA hydrolase [Phycisphaerales bacterium]|nr:MAG: aminoacyl-tRNA hydrolase [Phycisphaerales bacterium]